MNGTEEGKGENGDGNVDGNGESGPAEAERGRDRRNERRARAGRAAGAEAKNVEPLVGKVQTYGMAYEWEGANYIWNLQHP